MSSVWWRYCGHSVSIWSRLQSFHNCSWYQKQEKLSQSHPTIYLLLDRIELFTSSIGSIDTTQKVSDYKQFLVLLREQFLSTEKEVIILMICHNFRFLRYHCHCCRMCTNDPLLRLLLSLHNKGFKRKEATTSCIKHLLPLELRINKRNDEYLKQFIVKLMKLKTN